MILVVIAAATSLHCSGTSESRKDTGAPIDAPADAPADSAIDASEPEVPPPALDTVEMLLNGARVTLLHKLFCRTGATGIGFERTGPPDNALPTLFLHNVDLFASGMVLIKTGSAWHMDIDDVGLVWGTTEQGCMATVVESSSTTFALETVGCAIKNQFGTQTGMVSFHLRCARDDAAVRR